MNIGESYAQHPQSRLAGTLPVKNVAGEVRLATLVMTAGNDVRVWIVRRRGIDGKPAHTSSLSFAVFAMR